MAWVILIVAGVFEVAWASALKASNGFTNVLPSIVTAFAAMISFWLLAFAMKTLPLGTAYSVWVGIGAVGTVVVGVLWMEAVTLLRGASVGLIMTGILGLRLAEGGV